MSKLYQITFRWVKTEFDLQKITPVMDKTGNWYRMGVQSWYVQSYLSAAQIYEIIRHHIHPDDNVVIFEVVASSRFGWAPEDFWKWISLNNPGS